LKQEQDAARARRAPLLKDEKRWESERNVRAENHRREIAQQWANVAERPAARAELATHADRMARLNRALDLAEASDAALVSRINDLICRKNSRHARTTTQSSKYSKQFPLSERSYRDCSKSITRFITCTRRLVDERLLC
jgi:hypothetical protein